MENQTTEISTSTLNTDQDLVTETATGPTGGRVGPIWIGVQYFLADIGTTTCISFIAGLALTGAGLTRGHIGAQVFFLSIGGLVSLYIGYLLRKRSPEFMSLLGIILAAIIFGSAVGYASFTTLDSLMTGLLMTGASIVVYLIGWQAARMMKRTLFVPGNRLIQILAILGSLVVVFTLVNAFSLLG